MRTIDAQIHVYEANTPERPWAGSGHGPAEALGEDAVRMLDETGVDAAVIVSPWSIYRFDPAYSLRVAAAHPGRFGVVCPIDTGSPSDARAFVRAWAGTAYAVGVRMMLIDDAIREAVRDGSLDSVFAEIAGTGLPLCVACPGELGTARRIAEGRPDVTLVIDHAGLRTTFTPPPPRDTLDDLPELLALADLPNVVVKATGLPSLSPGAYPWPDIHAVLRRILDAFGPERVMWGNDWTRTAEFLSYEQGLRYLEGFAFRDEQERASLLGATADRVFDLRNRIGGP
ncbi:MAG: amidohydrolase family protein [Leifsonia sp.]|uniref:amidohydrolase family protein n=1 Tax=Leifsonia sp. TaxID=1870902 RepID=UPI003F7D1528